MPWFYAYSYIRYISCIPLEVFSSFILNKCMFVERNNLIQLRLTLITNVNSTTHGKVQELVKIASCILSN